MIPTQLATEVPVAQVSARYPDTPPSVDFGCPQPYSI